ncbi:hypothetical protein AB1Y20_001189 [Prymnesium parvum]|uniref:WW domain-containing protein n=1 Tax=Prymnesium parvum TaxID=97485 RepID=A0AB34KAD1_PRYPA
MLLALASVRALVLPAAPHGRSHTRMSAPPEEAAPPAPTPPALPPGWKALFDASWPGPYFVNPTTGATQWEPPLAEAPHATAAPPPPAVAQPASWSKASSVNSITQLEVSLSSRNSITEEPGKRGRFSRAWETMEKDSDWFGFVANRLLDALDDELYRGSYLKGSATAGGRAVAERQKVVVLGCGWGANAVLSQLKNAEADVTVVSPRSYFLFTPMLAGAALGTLEPRSIIQPIREAHPTAKYFEAEATRVNLEARTVTCASLVCEGIEQCEIREFDVPYDQLVVAVGASTNTFGVKGAKEHCLFLKSLPDAKRFRARLGFTFEQASLPGLTDAQRTELLTFVVIGSGPTGVELCGELRDFIAQDVPRLYKELVPFVRLVLCSSSNKDAALEKLRSSEKGFSVDVRLSAGVKEVSEDEIFLSDGSTIRYGLALWAAGIGTLDFVKQTSSAIGGQAEHAAEARGRLAVDRWLRVIGAPGVFAFGDCAHVVGSPYPATAQVASQAGTYLGRLMADGYDFDVDGAPTLRPGAPGEKTLRHLLSGLGESSKGDAPPFNFLNLGILAYVGKSEALVQIAVGGGDKKKIKSAGRAGFALWRSVYLSKQFGLRNRLLVAADWAKAKLFGRDLSRLS